jgi:hypothetical protein
VVMARAVGMPSRLAVGYVGGEFDSETGQYSVQERNTHAWVEVYFPRYGWVEFEPTASEEPMPRLVRSEEARPDGERRDVESDLERGLDRFEEVEDTDEGLFLGPPSERPSLLSYLLMATVVVLAAVGLIFWIVRLRRSEALSAVQKAYRLMCHYARFLGVRGEFYQTPNEYAVVLAERIPSGASHVERITGLFVQERFAPHAPGLREEQAAQEAWQELRLIMAREVLRRVPRRLRSSLLWRP